MKKILFLFTLLIFLTGSAAYAQKIIKIGDTEYIFRSPFKATSVTKSDTAIVTTWETERKNNTYSHEKRINRGRKEIGRFVDNFYIGMGLMCPLGGEDHQPVYLGNSFNLDIGFKSIYLATNWYGIGGSIQYSAYSYKLKTDGKDIFNLGVATPNGSHYYRTDNLGIGILNRFYLFPARHLHFNRAFLEFGAWGDFSYSKRLKIRDFSTGNKLKYKYRDGDKFNPFQAGVQGGIGYGCLYVYCKYRLSDAFNHKAVIIKEVPRFSIGIQLQIDL